MTRKTSPVVPPAPEAAVRVSPEAEGWPEDDGSRETMTMAEAVDILNSHVATYYAKISQDKLRMSFVAGNDFRLEGDGSQTVVKEQQLLKAGLRDCRGAAAEREECINGEPGGLNRVLLTDVTSDTGGFAYNGSAQFGLVSLREANMQTLVHEIGHGWMNWPHSYAEIAWVPQPDVGEREAPNPYSNSLDFMSSLSLLPPPGWHEDMPSTLAINRYAAGWIAPENVALHVTDAGTYTLRPPRRGAYQFLVISSGRAGAFTTVEVLDERNPAYSDATPRVYDPAAPKQLRAARYEGVLISRYDQSTGAGNTARFGPALYDERNPNAVTDVGFSSDDYSVVQDAESRQVGGGVRVLAAANDDGSYEIEVVGGRVAPFTKWCNFFWFTYGEYDTGCALANEDITLGNSAP